MAQQCGVTKLTRKRILTLLALQGLSQPSWPCQPKKEKNICYLLKMCSNPHLILKCHLAPFGAVNDTGWAISDQIATSCNENTGACQLNNSCTEPNCTDVNSNENTNTNIIQIRIKIKIQTRIQGLANLTTVAPHQTAENEPSSVQTLQCCKVQCCLVRIKCIALLGPASPATALHWVSYQPFLSSPPLYPWPEAGGNTIKALLAKDCTVYITIHLYFLTTQRSFKLIV